MLTRHIPFPIHSVSAAVFGAVLLSPGAVLAQDANGYQIDWHVIANGGVTCSTGGDWLLGATIGQAEGQYPNAPNPFTPLTGGGWTLFPGFWPDMSPRFCKADFNMDCQVNGDDLGDFITAYFDMPPDPRTDFDGNGVINADDLGDFVTEYFNGC